VERRTNMDSAQAAFVRRDGTASAAIHMQREHNEQHNDAAGHYIKSIVFGGLDGIITTFAIVSGVAGANLSTEVMLVLGFANLLADAISMGFGDYLSSQAEIDFGIGERKREEWEMENFEEGELQEMIDIYTDKGFSSEDANLILKTMIKNRSFFLDHMMVQELGILPVQDGSSPAKNGVVTTLSFIIFGSMPLFAFLLLQLFDLPFDVEFTVACVLTIVTLLILGIVKSRLVVGDSPLLSALKVSVNGVVAAGAAYLIGYGLGKVFNVSGNCGN